MKISLTGIAQISLRAIGIVLILAITLGPLTGLVMWSFAEKWLWPGLLPQVLGLRYWRLGTQGALLQAAWTGITIALIVTIVSLIISVPLSYVTARFRFPGKALILLLFLLPQAFPQLPVFANSAVLLYRLNLGGKVPGVILIHMVGALVYAVWTLTAVFRAIPVSLEEAAVNLGASRTRAFFEVTLPLAIPGLIASAILVFLWSLDEFTGTLLVGAPFVQTLPTFMYQAAQGYELQVASVTAILLMIPGILLLSLLERYLKAEYLSKFGGI